MMPNRLADPLRLKNEEIDNWAQGVLYEVEDSLGADAVRFPINVRRIAEAHYRLRILWDDTLKDDVLACICINEQEIRINERLLETQFEAFQGSESFTLAHEIGHWVLHVRKDQDAKRIYRGEPQFLCRRESSPALDSYEWQANRFAAALLMPEAAVKREAQKRALENITELYELRDYFGVSISAMTIRLKTLNIIADVKDKKVIRMPRVFD